MSETKKTAEDYKHELFMLDIKTKTLKLQIMDRLRTLCKRFPDAVIEVRFGSNDGTTIKARSIGDLNYIKMIDTEEHLKHIAAIEKWIADQNPVKQTKIDF